MQYIQMKSKIYRTVIYLVLSVVLYGIFLNYGIVSYASTIVRIPDQINTFTRVNSSNTLSSNRTLVIYVFGKSHDSAEDNLAFFIRNAVRASHDADYYIILQQINVTHFDLSKLPSLPSNARYLQHENKCFDLGTLGWFLLSNMIDRTKYKDFIFLNASVRGPFVVAYYPDPVWFTIFTRRLTDYIRLVGCTFSCQKGPHIQSYVWAMKLDTLEYLLKNSDVFTCHASMRSAINNGEVAASRVLLQAGYGIDSLMTKYRGLDLRTNYSAKCLTRTNPTRNKFVDGLTLDPYEVVFVKVKAGNPLYQSNSERITVYQKWSDG